VSPHPGRQAGRQASRRAGRPELELEPTPTGELITRLRAHGFTGAQARILVEEGWAEQVLAEAQSRGEGVTP